MTAPKFTDIQNQVEGVGKAATAEFIRMSAPANLSGIPSLSLPIDFSLLLKGLPIGMQIMGKPFDELTLLKVAAAYERETINARADLFPIL